MKHFRLLPLLILVSAITFSIRLGDFFMDLSRAGSASAQQEVSATPPPLPADAEKPKEESADAAKPADEAKPAEAAHEDGAPDRPGLPVPMAEKKDPPPAVKWKDPGDMALDDSEARAELYKDLAKRREDLDKKEKELNVREALLKAGEKEVDQKLKQLTDVRNEIKDLLKVKGDQDAARVQSLVKIYEGMKPDDAARIFNTLDLDVVMKVVGNMSERKSGPIIAAMSPERARLVTQMLVQQKQLPEIPMQ